MKTFNIGVRKRNLCLRPQLYLLFQLLVLTVTSSLALASPNTINIDWENCVGIESEFPLHDLFRESFHRYEMEDYSHNLSLAMCLLEGGYDPNTLNDRGLTPLSLADSQSIEVVQFLLNRGARVIGNPRLIDSAVLRFGADIHEHFKTPSFMDSILPYRSAEHVAHSFTDAEKILFAFLEAGGNLSTIGNDVGKTSLLFDLVFDVCDWEIAAAYDVDEFFTRVNQASKGTVSLSTNDLKAIELIRDAPALNNNDELVSAYPGRCLDAALDTFDLNSDNGGNQ